MKIIIYREKIGIPDFPESFSEFSIDNHQVELITISDFDRKETIDQELSELVSKGRVETPDILVIPVVLGSPLSYYGVRLAMHWRLDEVADNLNEIPIILLGDEDEASFFRHCDYSTFLKTPQVYYTQFNEYSITELIESGSVKHSNFKINSTLEHYNVKPPASYKSYHSVTNEWCILRWADALKINDEKITSIRKTIGASLYYKLLRCKYPISNMDDLTQKILLNKGTIMLVDDEVEKGWKSIFSKICNNQKLITIGGNFNGMETSEEIVNFTMDKVKSCEFSLDVVILDLRLSDNDFIDNLSPTDLTGYKILKEIKEFNQGIQVIVISATSKIWNLLELQKIGADGFIMKESPDLSIDPMFTKQSISNIYSSIDNHLNRSFLKVIFKGTKKIINQKLNYNQNCTSSLSDLKQSIKQNIVSAFILGQNEVTIDYSLFNYIQILESYCKFFTSRNSDRTIAYVYNNLEDRKLKTNGIVIYEVKDNIIYSNYKYEKGYYKFQKYCKSEKDKQFKNYIYDKAEYSNDDRFFSFALQLAAVLKIHLGNMNLMPKLMELIFIRNNKIAHSGQNFDSNKRKVNKNDIETIFQVVFSLIERTFSSAPPLHTFP
jgi:CheY-like chemotaxis protein